EARLSQAQSGLYAEIRSREGKTLWRSPSVVGTELDFGAGGEAPGEKRYERRPLADRSEVMALSSGLAWDIAPGTTRDFVFSVATDLGPYQAQLQRFRGQLL